VNPLANRLLEGIPDPDMPDVVPDQRDVVKVLLIQPDSGILTLEDMRRLTPDMIERFRVDATETDWDDMLEHLHMADRLEQKGTPVYYHLEQR
jgi:hypothetical protein